MGEQSIPGFCERCGRPFEVDRPAPGDRDLGLDRIKAAFRFCASCQLFVGRTCCWNPDALECTADAPVFALSTTLLPGGRPDSSATDAALSRGLGELSASLDNLEGMQVLIRRVSDGSSDTEVAGRAWDDAWSAIGWIIARVETSRDVAAKALWHTSATPDGPPAKGRSGELIGLEERYSRARTLIETHLRAAGKSLAAPRRRRWILPLGRRIQPTAFVASALMAVVVLSFSTAALLQLGYLDPFASNGSAVAIGPEGAVLGGAASQLPSNVPSPSATPPAPGP